MDTLFEKMDKAADIDALLETLSTARDAAEVRSILAENGIEASMEEVEAVIQAGMDELTSRGEAELDLDDLENVAGGGPVAGCFLGGLAFAYTYKKTKNAKIAAVVGTAFFIAGFLLPCP